jgi:Na+-translocating ferredoxin:NAD+ oxidoreductase RnfG subunit
VLALFAAITSVAIGWTYLGTKAQIDFEVRRAEARQLLEIFPPDTHDNQIVDDVFEVAAETRAAGHQRAPPGLACETGGYRRRRDSARHLPGTGTAVISVLW